MLCRQSTGCGVSEPRIPSWIHSRRHPRIASSSSHSTPCHFPTTSAVSKPPPEPEEAQQLTGAHPPADQFPQHAGRQTDRQTDGQSGAPPAVCGPHIFFSCRGERRGEAAGQSGPLSPLSGSMCFDTIFLLVLWFTSAGTHTVRTGMEEEEGRGWREGGVDQ